MNTYEVTLLVDACIYLQVAANSPEEAAEIADEKAGHVCLCHQCSDEIETGDTYGAHVYLAGKQVLDTTRTGSLEVQNAALKARIAELENEVEELADQMKVEASIHG